MWWAQEGIQKAKPEQSFEGLDAMGATGAQTVRFNGLPRGEARMVVRIVPTVRWRLSVRAALLLIGLAAWVIGVGLRVEEGNEDYNGSE